MAEYVKPRLVKLGTLAELTQICDKAFGASDGFRFQGNTLRTINCS